MELLLGAGTRRLKVLSLPGTPHDWTKLVTLDFNGDHNPDVVHDLNVFPWPFADNTFDEVHAYEVMEHLVQQGDFKRFFQDFSEIWRVLKPGGLFCGTSPAWNSPWAWGDPGHTRIISRECLIYLDQMEYSQIGRTPMTDYRFCYSADLECVASEIENGTYLYGLKAHKPARVHDAERA